MELIRGSGVFYLVTYSLPSSISLATYISNLWKIYHAVPFPRPVPQTENNALQGIRPKAILPNPNASHRPNPNARPNASLRLQVTGHSKVIILPKATASPKRILIPMEIMQQHATV